MQQAEAEKQISENLNTHTQKASEPRIENLISFQYLIKGNAQRMYDLGVHVNLFLHFSVQIFHNQKTKIQNGILLEAWNNNKK